MNEVKAAFQEIHIHSGRFLAGNTRGDREGWQIEYPVHEVFFSYDFTVFDVPVTFTEYENYCRDQNLQPPSDFCPKAGYALGRGEKPIVNVSWWDAIAYCNWMSLKENLPISYRLKGQENPGGLVDENNHITEDISKTKGYRLLTEAEWEYAAKGGHLMSRDLKFSGSDSLETVGWFWKNSGNKRLFMREKKWNGKTITDNLSKPQPVRAKNPNSLKIYDMSGNIWEWCYDWFSEYSEGSLKDPIGPKPGNQKVIRGGSWFFGKHFCRVCSRFYVSPNFQDFQTGFRLARTLHE